MKNVAGNRSHAIACGVALAALAANVEVAAQTDEAAAATGVTLEQIIVTAQRRAQQLEDVPRAVVAITTETLERSGTSSIHDIGEIAPGVMVEFNGAFTQPSIRGITTLTNGNTIENNVAIYVDGFYQPNPTAIDMGLVNIESIEILKGPQGTLYGRNATGGAILVNTTAPSDTLTGKVELSYGRFDDRRIIGYISGPLTDNMRYSIAASDTRTDGWIDLVDPNQVGKSIGDAAPLEEQTVRAKLAVDFSPGVTATFGYNYFHSDKVLGLLFSPFEYRPSFYPPPPVSPVKPGQAAYNRKTINPFDLHQGRLKLEFETPIGTLTSYTGYDYSTQEQTFDFDGSYADLTWFHSEFQQEVFQQTFDYHINAIDNLDLIVGAMYYDSDNGTDPIYTVFGAGFVPSFFNKAYARSESYAVYTDAAFQVTDRLNLGIGGRYTDETATSFFHQYTPAGADLFPATRKSKDYSKFTWSASARYEIADQTNVYASYARGFRSGYFNLSGAPTPGSWLPLKPEVNDAYEIGIKSARSNVRFDAAAFYYDYQDLHLSVTAPSPNCPPENPGCAIVTLYSNAPKAEVYGIDGQITVAPLTGLNVRLGFAWLHARYKEVPNASGTGLNAATMTNVSGQTQDWSGHEMTRSPEFSGTLGVDYEFPLPAGDLRLATNVMYMDSYVVNNPSLYGPLAGPELANKQRYRQGARTVVNGQITWLAPGGQFYITAYGNNLTDKKYRQTYSGGAFGDYGVLAAPITYGLKVGYGF